MVDFRRSSDREQRVIDTVKRRTPNAENIKIVSIQERFLDGVLFTVSFDALNGAGELETNYINRVYVTKKNIEVYGHDEFMLQIVGARHSKSFYDIFANGDVVSGIIALVVTILIVPSFIASYWTKIPIDVPDWITSGWLLILGFYFGKASGRSD